MIKTVEHGIQGTSKKAVEYGIRSYDDTGHDRRPNPGDAPNVYLTKQASSKDSGGFATQVKGIRNQKGASSYVPKGKVSSFGNGSKFGVQVKGFGGQVKGRKK